MELKEFSLRTLLWSWLVDKF